MSNSPLVPSLDYSELANLIKAWGKSLGFQALGIADIDLSQHHDSLRKWIEQGCHGDMSFFERNIDKRMYPDLLVPGTLRIISVRMNYLPEQAGFAASLSDPNKAFVSRYALGRDYHKLMRSRLKQLALKIQDYCKQYEDELSYRPFVDSAPVLEHAIAEKAGIGFTGKHSLTIDENAGSWFFLGELFINLPLPVDTPAKGSCGTCSACISICPTKAIVDDYKIDARRCISYLTIEHEGVIAEEFRKAMGNRIYGCDDCQLICPYNREAALTNEEDFYPRNALNNASLLSLFAWTEAEFLAKMQGSPIRRIGIKKWRRNISVALGNAPFSVNILKALEQALLEEADSTLTEHYQWAIQQQKSKQSLKQAQHIEIKDLTRQQARLIRSVQKGMPRDA